MCGFSCLCCLVSLTPWPSLKSRRPPLSPPGEKLPKLAPEPHSDLLTFADPRGAKSPIRKRGSNPKLGSSTEGKINGIEPQKVPQAFVPFTPAPIRMSSKPLEKCHSWGRFEPRHPGKSCKVLLAYAKEKN